MKPLNLVSHEDFEPCLNERFSLQLDDASDVELELIEVKPLGEADPKAETRQPFSLLFRGARDIQLPQKLYRLDNAKTGEMHLFLVPVGPDEEGMRYESSFN